MDRFLIFRKCIFFRPSRRELTTRYHLKDIPSLYHIRETSDLDWNTRKCCFDVSSFIIFESSYFSRSSCTHDSITLMDRSCVDKDRRDRTKLLIEMSFYDRRNTWTIRICLQLEEICLKEDHIEEIFDTKPSMR